MNKVCLTGRLTKNIEPKMTQSGKTCVSFQIAVRDYPTTYFFDVIAREKNAEYLGKYGTKGSPLAVDGKIISKAYTRKDGVKVNKIFIQAENVNIEAKTTENAKVLQDDEPEDITDDYDLPF